MTQTDATFEPPESFRCESRLVGDAMWVQPIGELDLDTASQLDQELTAAREGGADRMVLDMRALTFMDSTGLRLVIRWDTDAREQGFAFAIVPGPEVVQRVFRLTGMADVIPVVEPLD
ncbi:MAG TPA: STAS domain-containing protein [Solirubrobacteraceae bacterium]|nr:STAS domain-containing protein [Solirubrobacteraceae bacterium]